MTGVSAPAGFVGAVHHGSLSGYWLLEKMLKGANIKLNSVLTDIKGKSGRTGRNLDDASLSDETR